MGAARRAEPGEAVRITNRGGRSPFVLICDHASNFVPARYAALGLDAADLARHIAWDPGALPVASLLAGALDATLVESRISRLVIDCNRPLDAPDLISLVSESTPIPGNQGLTPQEREMRIALSWQPFHKAVEEVVSERLAEGRETMLVSIHSFNPVYNGVTRPWHVGVLHDADRRLSRPLIRALKSIEGVTVGDNQPYSPADRVYFTLERHGRSRGLACAMIEIRNDEIADQSGQRIWADRLSRIFTDLEPDMGRQEPGRQGVDHPVQPVN